MAKKTKKKENKKEPKQYLTRILRFTAGSGLIAFSICLILGMIGYNPEDKSFNVSNSPTDKVTNFMGTFGSYSADFIANSYGLAIFIFLIPLMVWGYLLMSDKKILELKIRIFAVILGILSLSGALWHTLDKVLSPYHLIGKFSHLLPEYLMKTFKSWGATGFENAISFILLTTIAIMSFNLAAGISFKQWNNVFSKIYQIGKQMTLAVWVFMRRLCFSKPLTTRSEKKVEENRQEPKLETNPEIENVKTKSEEKGVKIKNKAKVKSEPLPRTNKHESGYQYPDINLLSRPKEKIGNVISEKELNEIARTLEAVLEQFGVNGEIVKIRPGPVVTLFELEPAPGTKTSRVISLASDIARSMSAVSVRIAVVPGSNTIGIEIPNNKREIVWLRDLLEDVNFTDSKNELNVVLGKDIGGKNVYADLAKMPHLLVAGTTGSGKSVGVNAMILSLLYRMTPEECKFILIDPKMLEFSMYNGIPHLLTPVITDPAKAVIGLKWAVREMEERYRAMACLSVRNIGGYNLKLKELRERGEQPKRTIQVGFDPETGEPKYEEQLLDTTPLPYIVIVVDEMADLMLVAGKEVEAAIQRLAQMARAAGIHLIMSTQRPSVDVITGTIKSNFPTRISFQVTSKIDSRTILGEQGAEQLLGKGDMLYMPAGLRPQRVHAGFVKDEEVEGVVNFLKSQSEPNYVEGVTEGELTTKTGGGSTPLFDKTPMGGSAKNEDLYHQAVEMVRNDKKASTSYVQRRLGIGYNKAATIIERMEEEGIITPADHVGRREVI